jgi:hypothetical protein
MGAASRRPAECGGGVQAAVDGRAVVCRPGAAGRAGRGAEVADLEPGRGDAGVESEIWRAAGIGVVVI